jgi:hypothetical protein
MAGSGDMTLTVDYEANPLSSQRMGTISIEGSGITREPTITQSGKQGYFTYNPTESNYLILINNVTLDGQVIDNGDEVGLFFRDENDELVCGGALIWPNTVLEAWGDDSQTPEKDGFVSGEEFVFVLWDISTQSEITPPVNMNYVTGDGSWGTGEYTEISLMEYQQSCALTIDLSEGWNWISSNVIPPDPDVAVVWDGVTGLSIVKSYNGFYVPGVWNSIGDWDNTQMYKSHLSSPSTLVIEGVCVNPELPIELAEGWNWVGYLPENPVNAEIALSSILSFLSIAKCYDGFFVPGVWNSIGDMECGKGYTMHTQQSCTLIYSLGEPLVKDKELDQLPITKSDACTHFGDYKTTEDYQALLVQSIITNGVDISAGDEIGVYTESGLCVGSAVVTDKYPMGMMVWMDDPKTEEVDGFEPGDKMVMIYWDSSEDKEYNVSFVVEDGSERLGESVITKVSLTVELITALESAPLPTSYRLDQNYPNPFNPETKICFAIPEAGYVNLTIYNIEGKLVKQLVHGFKEVGYHQVSWNGINTSGESVSSGVYIYRIDTGKFSNIKKMIFLK